LILSDKTTAVLAKNIPPLGSVAAVREYRMVRARAEFYKTRTTNAMDLRKAPEEDGDGFVGVPEAPETAVSGDKLPFSESAILPVRVWWKRGVRYAVDGGEREGWGR
jgi:hypothetical protein